MKKIIMIFLLASLLPAQQTSPITGQTFFDFTYNNEHYLSQLKNRNSFDIKRILVFYDKQFEDNLNFRFGLEGNNADFAPSGTYNIFLKALFIEKKICENNYSIQAGLFPTSTNAFDEKIWGNRFLEKVILDRTGLGSPTDIGVSIKGNLVSDLSFNLAIVNGTGIKPENDKNKKILSSFQYKLLKDLTIELYNDFENVANGKNKMTNKVTAGFTNSNSNIGLTLFQKKYSKLATNMADSVSSGFSIFGSYNIFENVKAIGRYDSFDKNDLNTITRIPKIFCLLV